MTEQPIQYRKLADGSIDHAYYANRARELRSRDFLNALQLTRKVCGIRLSRITNLVAIHRFRRSRQDCPLSAPAE